MDNVSVFAVFACASQGCSAPQPRWEPGKLSPGLVGSVSFSFCRKRFLLNLSKLLSITYLLAVTLRVLNLYNYYLALSNRHRLRRSVSVYFFSLILLRFPPPPPPFVERGRRGEIID